MNNFFRRLVVLAAVQYRISQTEYPSSNDPNRPYSTFDAENNQHIRHLTPPFGDFIARTTKYNLEYLELLQEQNLFPTLSPPQIEIITDVIISKLHTINDPKKEYIQFIKYLKKKSSQQLKVDLALASIMGIAGDLAPTNIPEYSGEVNAVVDGKKIKILDIDNLGLEIEPLEFFLYGVNAFESSLEFLKNDDLKKIALLRLQKIFPQKTSEEIKTIFDEKITLIKQATTDPVIKAFFENQDNYDKILKLQNGEISIDQISPLKVRKWLITMSQFNDKVFEIMDDVAQSLSVNSAQSLLSTEQRLEL